jgi:hypothetical protein
VTDNLPAIPTPPPAREVATADVDSWVDVAAPIFRLAEHIAGTEFVPRQMRNSAPAVAAAILYGREVGLAPMTALTQTHVIEGKPSMSAEAMRALVLSQGHSIVFEEATGAACIIRATRAGSQDSTRLAWTIDQARAAGLTGKDNWKKYPRAMLIARCTADICRMVFPDVIHGFRAEEEFDEQLADAAVEPATPTTKVARKRAAAKKSASAEPAPLEVGQRPERPSGPPLPGEDGYDAPAPRDAAPEQAGEASGGEPDDSPAPDVSDADESADAEPVAQAADESVSEDEPARSARSNPRPISKPQQRMLMSLFAKFELTDDATRAERLDILSKLADRPISSSSDLSTGEASRIIDTLARVEDASQLLAIANGDPS